MEIKNTANKKSSTKFEEKIKKMRNIGIIAHIDAGKTTTTERLLFYTGNIHKTGEVHEGKAKMDFLEEERARGITVTAAATTFSYRDHNINLIDTPGHVDFTIEVERSLKVLDGAILILGAKEGVQPQTLTVTKQAKKYGVPLICFFNKLDRDGVFEKMAHDPSVVLNELKEKDLHHTPVIINYPVWHSDEKFYGVIDLISKVYYCWEKDPSGKTFETRSIPSNLESKILEAREIMLMEIMFHDEELSAKYNDVHLIPEDEIKNSIRKLVRERKILPVIFGASLRNKGVQNLLDAIIDYLPSPNEANEIKVTLVDRNGEELVDDNNNKQTLSLSCDPDGKPCAFIFKTFFIPKTGKIIFVRIYSGKVSKGDNLFNPSLRKSERISRIVKMDANKMNDIETVDAGEVAAFIIKDTSARTGDTLCSEDCKFKMEGLSIPASVVSRSIEAQNKEQLDKLVESIQRMVDDDPSLIFYRNERGQMIIQGMGTLHLDIVISRLKNEFNVNAIAGRPDVLYKATIGKPVEVIYLHKKQTGGHGEFAGVSMKFEPATKGSGLHFVSAIVGGAIPNEYIPAVEEGIQNIARKGLASKYQVTDLKVTLFDGRYHDVDSSAKAFDTAARSAFREAMQKTEIIILEPIARLEITCPQADNIGKITGEIAKRRGQLKEQRVEKSDTIIESLIPLEETFTLTDTLRSITSGNIDVAMEFEGYEKANADVNKKVLNTLSSDNS